jgi:hypothetical protein
MNPLLLGPLFELGKGIIDRLFPDPQQKAAAELELMKLTQDGDMKQILAQLDINAREAQHTSIFVAGWRPFFGWVGGIGFLYATVIQPMVVWYGQSRGWPVPPEVNLDLLWVVVTGMLGIGGLRTFEKSKGVA